MRQQGTMGLGMAYLLEFPRKTTTSVTFPFSKEQESIVSQPPTTSTKNITLSLYSSDLKDGRANARIIIPSHLEDLVEVLEHASGNIWLFLKVKSL